MNLDLTITTNVRAFGRTVRLPAFRAWLTPRAFNLVGVTPPATVEVSGLSGRALTGMTYATDFFFWRLIAGSLTPFLVEALIPMRYEISWDLVMSVRWLVMRRKCRRRLIFPSGERVGYMKSEVT